MNSKPDRRITQYFNPEKMTTIHFNDKTIKGREERESLGNRGMHINNCKPYGDSNFLLALIQEPQGDKLKSDIMMVCRR